MSPYTRAPATRTEWIARAATQLQRLERFPRAHAMAEGEQLLHGLLGLPAAAQSDDGVSLPSWTPEAAVMDAVYGELPSACYWVQLDDDHWEPARYLANDGWFLIGIAQSIPRDRVTAIGDVLVEPPQPDIGPAAPADHAGGLGNAARPQPGFPLRVITGGKMKS